MKNCIKKSKGVHIYWCAPHPIMSFFIKTIHESRERWVSEELAIQTWGPKFHTRTHVKTQMWCVLLIPELRRQRQEDTWGLLVSLLSELQPKRQHRWHLDNDTHRHTYMCPCTYTYVYLHICAPTQMHAHPMAMHGRYPSNALDRKVIPWVLQSWPIPSKSRTHCIISRQISSCQAPFSGLLWRARADNVLWLQISLPQAPSFLEANPPKVLSAHFGY